MTTIELASTARYEEANAVMELYVENVNPTAIAKKLGVKRVDVLEHIKEWKESNSGNKFMQERVEELLALSDEHYSKLIRGFYDVVQTIDVALTDASSKDRAALLGQKNTALKAIADVEAKRIDMLQKAGLLEAADLGDQFAEQEAKAQQIMNIIRDVTSSCDVCRPEVSRRLAEIMGKADPTIIDSEVVEN